MAGIVATLSLLSLALCPVVSGAFVHPGLLVTQSDIDRAVTKIEANLDPWISSWYDLGNSTYASASYQNNAVEAIYRGSDGVNAENTALLWHDAAAAFSLALRWKISGNESYADAAASILRAWGATLTTIGGNDDAYLAAGFQGHEFANAGELMRDYAPFAEEGLEDFSNMMTSVFLPMNLAFLNHELGSEHNVVHFFANWELGNLASAMAIAVLTDNQTLWEYGVDYFKNGTGNGCINLAVSNLVTDPDSGATLGQGQESGRDQGHSALDQQMLGVVGQQAWNQGEDFFGYNNSRILQGAEYFARYNLGYDVPFENYTNAIVYYSEISNASRGSTRPTWELLYSHYVQVKGLDAPWTTEYLNYSLNSFGGYEPGAGSWGEGSGHYDGLGWGTLLYHMDDDDVAAMKADATVLTASSYSDTSSTALSVTTTSPAGTSPTANPATQLISASTVTVDASTVQESMASTKPTSDCDRHRHHQ